ncbi:hypothetical protein, partial [Mesorhizobium sp. M0586]
MYSDEALRVALVVDRNLLKVWRRKPVRALAADQDESLPNLQPDGVVDPLHQMPGPNIFGGSTDPEPASGCSRLPVGEQYRE